MKFLLAIISIILVLSSGEALAQDLDCRKSGMSPDGPAFCAWQREPSLPEARTYHSVTSFQNQIYVLGGFRFDASSGQFIYYDTVLRSTIGGDGHLSVWTPEPSFKSARSGAAAVVVGSCLVLAGGSQTISSSSPYFDDVQYSRITPDGRLSPWTTNSNHLKTPRSNLSLVAVTTPQGTFLNAIAGVTQIGADTVQLDTVEFAKLESDCSVGVWSIANYHLRGGRSTPQAIVIRNNTAVVGGWGDLGLIDVFDDVQTANGRPDGSPAPWRVSSSRLPTGIYGHATVLAETKKQPGPSLLLSLGGQPGTGAYADWISYAYVMQDAPLPDAIGTWRIAPAGKMPTGRAGLSVIESHARLYLIGGNGANSQYFSDVLSAQFDFGIP